MESPKKYDRMMMQIRQLLSHSSLKQETYPQDQHNLAFVKKQDHLAILQQSQQILRKSSTSTPLSLKILAANSLLSQSPIQIRQYIKQKITSQIYTNNYQHLNQQNLLAFQQRKQQALSRRKQEIHNEIQRRAKIVQKVKKFQQQHCMVPLMEIDKIIQNQRQQELTYLMANRKSNHSQIQSKSNQLPNVNLFLSQVYSQHQLQNSRIQDNTLFKNKNRYFDQFNVVNDQFEDQKLFQSQNLQFSNKCFGLNQLLTKNPNLVKIFYKFLEKQVRINSLNSVMSIIPSVIKSQDERQKQKKQQKEIYTWKVKQKKRQNPISLQPATISVVTSEYRFSPKLVSPSQHPPIPICSLILQKRIGSTTSFHAKKCQLTSSSIKYYQENDKSKDIKEVLLKLGEVEVGKTKKEEGSFWSKKEIDVEVINVKGTNRDICFILDQQHGRQFQSKLKQLFANKIYQLHAKLNANNNLLLFDFINNRLCKQFSLCGSIYPNIKDKQNKQQQWTFVKIICDLLKDRTKIEHLQVSRSNLATQYISKILDKSGILKNLNTINLSRCRLSKQSIQQVFQLVNTCSNTQMHLTLKYCHLQDQAIQSNIGILSSIFPKLIGLDFSGNGFTGKFLQLIKPCFQNGLCGVKYFKLNYCKIKQFNKIAIFIRDVRKLQQLELQQCGFELQNRTRQDYQLFSQALKKNTSIKNIKLTKNGFITHQGIIAIRKCFNNQNLNIIQVDININGFESNETGPKKKQLISQSGQMSNLSSQLNFMLKINNVQ